MVERVKDPWRTSDGQTFPSRAEAEKHEGKAELEQWFDDRLPTDTKLGEYIADQIIVGSANFVSLLRKAGVPLIVRERTAKSGVSTAKPRRAPKAQPEAAE